MVDIKSVGKHSVISVGTMLPNNCIFSYKKNAKHKQVKSDSNRRAYFWGPEVMISGILSQDPDCTTVTQN